MTSFFHCSTFSTVVFFDQKPLRYRLNLRVGKGRVSMWLD
jgi:hypothetical protein